MLRASLALCAGHCENWRNAGLGTRLPMTDGGALDETQLLRYLRDGFVVLGIGDLDARFHAAMFDAARAVHDEARAVRDAAHVQVIGDNLRARIPALDGLLDAPALRGALTSVLGDGFLLHPHHFVHEASGRDQSFHQDGNLPWNDRGHYRTHRPDWAMLFYYPQAVTVASGPTEVLPGSQYWTTNFEKPNGGWHRGDAVDKVSRADVLGGDDPEARERHLQGVVDSLGIAGLRRRKIELPAGSVVLAHYDLMHRGSRTAPTFDSRRFMYKFYYFRTRDPQPSAPRPDREDGPTPASGLQSAPAHPSPLVVDSIRHWLRGDTRWRPEVAPADQAARIAVAPAEDERVRLAYEIGWLARGDVATRDALGHLLASEDEAVRRSMAYAAGIAGAASEAAVRRAIASADARVRRVGVYAAGEARLTSAAVQAALFERLEQDADDLVRSNAAYALGHIARVCSIDAGRLLARLDVALEPDNTTSGGMARSTVRESVMYAICNARLDAACLEAVAQRGLADHDRYVRGLAVALLQQRARQAPAWLRGLVDHLAGARYNSRSPDQIPSAQPAHRATAASTSGRPGSRATGRPAVAAGAGDRALARAHTGRQS